jgi:hypothetical protein
MAAPTDYLPPELVKLLDVARAELDRHTRSGERCAACQQIWPCPRAELAAFTLETI